MAEIVNLRTVRRRREREASAGAAADNRSRYGRTGAQKRLDAIEAARQAATLDGARIERAGEAPDEPAPDDAPPTAG